MKPDVQLSRRTFLAGVTALAGGFIAAGCGGGGNSGSGKSVTLHQVNPANAQALVNDMAASAAAGAITPTLKQVYEAAQSNLSTSQMNALVSAGQQLSSPETTAAWVKQYWDASKRQFVFPQDIQDALAIVEKIFPSLPYSGGLVTVETAPTRSFPRAQAVSGRATANSRGVKNRALASSRGTTPTPTLSVVNPALANETTEALTVTATGSGFVQGTTTVVLTGVVSASITATVLSATQLTFVLPASALGLAGALYIAVSNGASLVSATVGFNVLPQPTATCSYHTDVMVSSQYSVEQQCPDGSSCGETVYYYAQFALEYCCTLIGAQGNCAAAWDADYAATCVVVTVLATLYLTLQLIVTWSQDWDNCDGFYCQSGADGTGG